jgi:acetyl esterase
VPTPDGDIGVRLYQPAAATLRSGLPIVVAFHGGGWVFGNLDTAEWLFSAVAARVEALVLAVNYQLAPEHPAPAALRDAVAVTAWVAAHATQIGGRADRLALLGESSGATLAAAVALAARDSGGPEICYQALLYPITDLTLSSPSVVELPNEPLLTSADLKAYVNLYLSRDGDPTDPYLSPLLARDHRHLAPALILTADHDPLRDDGRRYAERLQDCGVSVRHSEYIDSPHGFFSFPNICWAAGPALDELTDALRVALCEEEWQGRLPLEGTSVRWGEEPCASRC